MASRRLEIVYLDINEVTPYDRNARDNTPAIPAVKQSFLKYGWRIPIVVDANRVLVCGHTRVAAAKEILREQPELADEYSDVPCLIADDLTPEQIKAFRLVDNKTSELATWDFDLLAGEVSYLRETGVDLTAFGWSQEELDCLQNVVSADCLTEEPPAADGVSGAINAGRSLSTTKDGLSVRIAFGDVAFFVLKKDFEAWIDARRRAANYDMDTLLDGLAQSLGLKDAKAAREESLKAGGTTEHANEVFDRMESEEQDGAGPVAEEPAPAAKPSRKRKS